jgi:hypothetical protein
MTRFREGMNINSSKGHSILKINNSVNSLLLIILSSILITFYYILYI